MTWLANFSQKYLFTPNGLSFLRGIFGASLPFFLLRPESGYHLLALTLFIVGAITDYWDGLMARTLGLQSQAGKIIDPTMDKILVLAPLATFAVLGVFSIWWIVPIFIREILITFCRIGWMMEGKAVGAEPLGKYKFGFQVAASGAALLYFITLDYPILTALSGGIKMLTILLLIMAMALTLISGFDFTMKHRENFKSRPFARFVSALGVGLIPFWPGTWGSAVGMSLVFLVQVNGWLYLGTLLLLVAVGYWAVSRIDLAQNNDPHFVVVDEACGIFITFLGISLTWRSVLIGFLLFRLFDVWKPYPIKRLEKLPGYWGILCDDLAAGFYAWIVLLLFFHG